MANVSLQEIATKCGVSHVTVSRVLNEKAHLHKAATVELVQRVAREMGYRPNLLAKSMKSGRTRTIGIVMRPGSDSWFMHMQLGIHHALLAENYLPITLSMPESDLDDLELIHSLLDRRVDGIILWPSTLKAARRHLDELLKYDTIVATVDTEIPEADTFDYAGTDDELGGCLAADHLLSLGHRNFGILTYTDQNPMCKRCESFTKRIQETSGVRCHSEEFRYFSDDDRLKAAARLFRSTPAPTAIFAANDVLAWAVYRAAAQLNLRIPDDLSVLGYADLTLASMLTPPLSTIRQEPREIGEIVSKMIVERIEKRVTDAAPRRVFLKPTLIVRESTKELL